MEATIAGRLGRLARVVCLLSAGVTVASAQAPAPRLAAPVNDFANAIDAASAAELDRRIRALQAATGDAVVVATVPTFKPFGSIEDYAVQLFEIGGE